MLEELDLSGSAGVIGPLSASWPQWMPYLKNLSLSGASNLVGAKSWRFFCPLLLYQCVLFGKPSLQPGQQRACNISRRVIFTVHTMSKTAPCEQSILFSMALLLCMQGPIPSQWGNSTYWQESLVELRLANSGLTSALPAPWNLHNLTHLDVSNNSLTGPSTAVFTYKLEYLDISNNAELTGSWDAINWGGFTSLIVLRMSNIGFTESEFPGELRF
jgi:Leucine-rich repeat (LRR) protein